MRKKESRKLNFPMFMEEASDILAKRANRLHLMEATLIANTPFLIYLTSFVAFDFAVEQFQKIGRPDLMNLATVGLIVFLSLLTTLVTFPLLVGLVELGRKAYLGEDLFLQDVFFAFQSGKNYKKAYYISINAVAKLLILLLLEVFLQSVMFALTQGSILGTVITAILSVAVFVLWIVAFAGSFFRAYYILGEPEAETMFAMHPMARSVAGQFFLRFLPKLLLSLLTFGILFLADVLPRMLITYFSICDKISETTTRSEDLIK